MRRAAGDGRLDALLVFAVAELHQRLVVEAQPGDAAALGRAHQRGGRGAERAALREADELIARLGPVPAVAAPRRPDGARRAAGSTAVAGRARRPRYPHRAARTRRRRCRRPGAPALRVLPKVTSSPAMFCSSMATCSSTCPSQVPSSSRMRRKKPARLAVRAAVLRQAGKRARKRVDESGRRARRWARPRARPGPAPGG